MKIKKLIYCMEGKDCCCIFIAQQEIMKPIMRRKFLVTAATLTAGTAASALPLKSSDEKKQLVHHVFFWLKNPDSLEDRDKLVEGVRTLAKIETIRKLHVGVLASTEKRDVVDTSWQVSELMFFDDTAGQKVYQDHPIHQAFVKNYSHLWAKVLVYDAAEV
jgi:Stress responsive A/B Barrel Domain